VCLGSQPASRQRVHLKWSPAELADFIASVREIPPDRR
jgi:hypothetical protein